MNLLQKYPNIKNLITSGELNTITSKELDEIKKASNYIREKIEISNKPKPSDYDTVRKLLEESIANGELKYNPSQTAKQLIIANVLFPSDHDVVDTIIDAKAPYDTIYKTHLEIIIRFNTLLKNNTLNPSQIDEEFKTQLAIYERFMAIIVQLFQEAFGISDQTVILNRITEIMKYKSNYFDKLKRIPNNHRKK